MQKPARTAKSMEYAIGGVADKFRFWWMMADAELLAKAFFHRRHPRLQAAFISYGMGVTFDTEL